MDKILDKYTVRARLNPALISLLPVAIALLAWVPKIGDVTKPLLGLVTAVGFVALLASVARTAGKSAETRLLREWGGSPTVAMLRHQDETVDPVSKARYHARLGALVPGIKMPTSAEETRDTVWADDVYRSCVAYLREATRDQEKFPLVFAENVDYGFIRNLYGLRPIGIGISVAGTVGCAWKLVRDHAAGSALSPLAVLCAGGCLALLLLWCFFVRARTVRRASDDYARRLLETIDRL